VGTSSTPLSLLTFAGDGPLLFSPLVTRGQGKRGRAGSWTREERAWRCLFLAGEGCALVVAGARASKADGGSSTKRATLHEG